MIPSRGDTALDAGVTAEGENLDQARVFGNTGRAFKGLRRLKQVPTHDLGCGMSGGGVSAMGKPVSTNTGKADMDSAEAPELSRLPPEFVRSLTSEQRALLLQSLPGRAWRRHPVDLRFSIPWFGRGLFVTVVAGTERAVAQAPLGRSGAIPAAPRWQPAVPVWAGGAALRTGHHGGGAGRGHPLGLAEEPTSRERIPKAGVRVVSPQPLAASRRENS